MSVSELAEQLFVAQPTISHHLAILRRANLVTVRREGRWRFYRANPACVMECCGAILARFTSPLTTIAKAISDDG